METRFLLIGDGRLSLHLLGYIRLLGLNACFWSRRNNSVTQLHEFLKSATHVLCLISDDAIEPFLLEHSERLAGKTVVHMSGVLVSKRAYGAHPLMTFRPGEIYGLDIYKSIPFVTEFGGPALTELLPGFPNSSYAIPREKKALYHALCVMSGNFTTMLWQKAFTEFEGALTLPHEILFPYLHQIVNGLEQNPSRSLTGPLARKDVQTVRTHLLQLKDDPFYQVYRGFVHASGMEV